MVPDQFSRTRACFEVSIDTDKPSKILSPKNGCSEFLKDRSENYLSAVETKKKCGLTSDISKRPFDFSLTNSEIYVRGQTGLIFPLKARDQIKSIQVHQFNEDRHCSEKQLQEQRSRNNTGSNSNSSVCFDLEQQFRSKQTRASEQVHKKTSIHDQHDPTSQVLKNSFDSKMPCRHSHSIYAFARLHENAQVNAVQIEPRPYQKRARNSPFTRRELFVQEPACKTSLNSMSVPSLELSKVNCEFLYPDKLYHQNDKQVHSISESLVLRSKPNVHSKRSLGAFAKLAGDKKSCDTQSLKRDSSQEDRVENDVDKQKTSKLLESKPKGPIRAVKSTSAFKRRDWLEGRLINIVWLEKEI